MMDDNRNNPVLKNHSRQSQNTKNKRFLTLSSVILVYTQQQ